MRIRKFLSLFILFLFLLPITFFITACDNSSTNDGKLSAEQIYEQISPSVVSITAESSTFISSGTGFFYNNGSTVVTNYHVIKDCSTASITLDNGKEYEILSVLGYDKNKDIAILKVDYDKGKPLTCRTADIKTGETVYAIGNSLGFLGGSLSEGIISTANREFDGQTYIQTTAAVTNGNSGGPLLDAYGKVVGIVSAGFGDGLDLNLAIPISRVNTISTSNPFRLEEIINVEWISNRQIWHQDENNRYVLVFTLADPNKNPVAVSGRVIITIKNDYNEIVYSAIRKFTKDDFKYWYYDNYTVKKYQATIYINDADITPNYCQSGNISFSVVGSDYSFASYSLAIDDHLPLKSFYNDTVTEKTVYTAQEFVDSINHNRKIILGAKSYDFSNVDISKNKLLQSQSYNRKEFIINGVYNLSIEGDAEILINDLSSVVLSFNNCSKLSIKGLTVGHINPPNNYSCEGAVIYLNGCNDIKITNSKLFGCGSIGIDADNTTGLLVSNTEIYDCSYTGISLLKTTATFNDCKIYDLNSYSVIDTNFSTASFNSCSFTYTNVTANGWEKCFIDVMDYGGVSNLTFESCSISNNTFTNIATVEAKNILFKNSTFISNNGLTSNSGVTYQGCTFK